MTHYPKPATRAPFDLSPGACRWVYDSAGRQFPIAAVTRRRVLVACGPHRLTLRRRRLERDGYDTAAGLTFTVSRYLAPLVADAAPAA